jgi:hypothetical protein
MPPYEGRHAVEGIGEQLTCVHDISRYRTAPCPAGEEAAAVLALLPVAASVPAHRALGGGFDASVHARLLATNWLRTAAWTAHAAVAGSMLLRASLL